MKTRIVRGRDFEHVLHPGTYVIGRDSDCRLKLSSQLVSRRHAVLMVSPQSLTIEDLGSSRGVVVNGRKVTGPHALSMGDVVTLADETLTFMARAEAARSNRESASTAVSPTAFDDHDATEVERPPVSQEDQWPFSKTVDEALTAGRISEVETLVSTRWSVLATLRGSDPDGAARLADTARGALRLALAKKDSAWVGRVMIAFLERKLLMPVPVVEALGACVAAFPNDHHDALKRYRDLIDVEKLREDPKNAFAILRYYSICRRIFMAR